MSLPRTQRALQRSLQAAVMALDRTPHQKRDGDARRCKRSTVHPPRCRTRRRAGPGGVSGALDFAATHTYSVCMAMIIDVKRDAAEGLWRVMKEGGARASARKETQEMAKQAAITIARRTGGVVRVWKRDGSKFTDLTIPRS